ncbi:NUDIX hydrolase [Photobacterium sp. DNB23_23_1]|uniref:NUDIX domain-containing protein n=1 Tax=Photobacterium pectinilyticum TaxID=2906793 RepID=A0ABT1N021_9GAMM|nr:NUDIX domain-containing protein [Photobacterium sp. ZSDE20]MCQ1058009.1 NUDIX domain-containing protein [Photobacterium sp. ZSDE20]MDD1822542.1 NUDIX domain-containing protein [Photobacterium sp. ZSDE20]
MYCPSCGQASLARTDDKAFRCEHCQFIYFHNTASAILAVICFEDEILVAERGREPCKGMLDFPGGFVDYDESLEQALYRELQEELGFQPSEVHYIGSAPNTYVYRDIEYKTCDAFYHITLENKPTMQANDDVAAIRWVKRDDIVPINFAFDSARSALRLLGIE